jgi:tripartite-type tricarboxylate transporter receptor subunit TctC
MEDTMHRRAALSLLAALSAAAWIGSAEQNAAYAQSWPTRSIRMIVPYTPGGYTDYMARTVSQKLSEALGQNIIIENKPGANSVIGADAVAKAAPDGYTFGTVIAAHAANATLNPKLPFDTMKDFTYVSLLSVAPLLMVAHPSLPANNVQELIALAKAKPGELNFASSGIGAAAHLTMEMFKSRVGINMQHVPYRGTAPALQDILAGRINVMFDTVGAFTALTEAGKLKAIAVTAKARMPAAPNVPTMVESGVPDFVSGTWAGMIAPAGVPKEIVDRVAAEAGKILRDPAMREQLAKLGYEAVGNTPQEYEAFMRKEVAQWAAVIKDAGIKMEE